MIKTANLTGSVSRNAGGLFESVRRLVQSLALTGMEVRVFGTEDEHTAADRGQWAPVPVRAVRPLGPHQFGYSPQYRRDLMEFEPDLVHTHGLWTFSSIATNQYRRRRGVPYVISAHGMLDPWAIRNSRWKKVIAHFFYEGAHLRDAGCLRALCQAEADAIRQLGLKNPIAIIPNGIDLPVPGPADDPAPWAGLIEPGRPVLLFLSRIHPKKGLANLLEAWAAVQASGAGGPASDWTLAIAGWDQGGHEADLKRQATALGLPWSEAGSVAAVRLTSDLRPPASVCFLGPQFNAAKAACYRHCQGFILPSFSEGVPMVVLEAWAYGKPVLMTPACNLPAGFARGAALRIDPGVDSIAQGLREFFQASAAQRQTLGENGLRLVRERFVWSYLAEEMKKLYEWMLGGGPKPDCVV